MRFSGTLPQQIRTIDNKLLNLNSLYNIYDAVIVITLKTTSCPVCPQLLKLIKFIAAKKYENYPSEWSDELSDYKFRMTEPEHWLYRLALKNVVILVISPGTLDGLKRIAEEVKSNATITFEFIHDDLLQNTNSLHLRLGPFGDMCLPAVFMYRVHPNESEELTVIVFVDESCRHHPCSRMYGISDILSTTLDELEFWESLGISQLYNMSMIRDDIVSIMSQSIPERPPNPSTSPLVALPSEVLIQTLSYLPIRDLFLGFHVCRRLRYLSLDNILQRLNQRIAVIKEHLTNSRESDIPKVYPLPLLKDIEGSLQWEVLEGCILAKVRKAICARDEWVDDVKLLRGIGIRK
ncbi:hypothetical protein BKA69DRAFT_1124976 [Paraphysoderma sedebokerense]|nr:hypothetical protein BKA69DRAFT_1124976 [Paraphysoderma sedebokerense]